MPSEREKHLPPRFESEPLKRERQVTSSDSLPLSSPSASAPQPNVWLRLCVLDVTTPFSMPHCGPHLSASSTSHAIALRTSSCRDSFLCEGHGPLACEFPLALCLSWLQPISLQPAVL